MADSKDKSWLPEVEELRLRERLSTQMGGRKIWQNIVLRAS